MAHEKFHYAALGEVAEKAAALRGLTLAEVAAATTRNAETLYGLGKTH